MMRHLIYRMVWFLLKLITFLVIWITNQVYVAEVIKHSGSTRLLEEISKIIRASTVVAVDFDGDMEEN